jgi:hypothetical protein
MVLRVKIIPVIIGEHFNHLFYGADAEEGFT